MTLAIYTNGWPQLVCNSLDMAAIVKNVLFITYSAHLKNVYQSCWIARRPKFFTFARTALLLLSATFKSTTEFPVSLGCVSHHAHDVIYADHVNINKPQQLKLIGSSCVACDSHQFVVNYVFPTICGAWGFTISTLTNKHKQCAFNI